MSLADYLHEHFVDKAAFAALAGIEVVRLDELIAAQAIPQATYTCDGVSIASAVFGRTQIDEPLSGAYFRPQCVRWVRIAEQAPPGSERGAVLAALTGELRTAMAGCFDTQEAIESRIRGYLPYFFDGTFGLCVADPSSGAGIAKKEVLQERLVALTANGSAPPPDVAREDMLRLIDDYASAAMPFSPAEYGRSSRKRLVDDLKVMLS
jgi:hypothetical protein